VAKNRARIIDADVIEVVLVLLNEWSGKLTWNALIAQIRKNIGVEYTRQALANHRELSREFSLRKLSLKKEVGRPIPADNRLAVMLKTIERLQSEKEMLSTECNNYRAMFVVWTSNAVKRGITEKQMNAPLQPAMRPSSDDPRV
jgi:hypothetical protein